MNVLVLCYHAISARWPAALSVTPVAFARQMKLLSRAGYVGTTFSQAVLDPPARRTVAITFDDAYRSELLAAPVLRTLGWPATIFAPTDHIGSEQPMSWPGIDHWVDSPHGKELVPLDWGELRSLAQEGWEIGSHTCSHPRLTEIATADAREELHRSKACLEEELQAPCVSVAYPFGDVDEGIVDAAGAVGYRTGAGLPDKWRRERPLDFPRVGVWHGDRLWRAAVKAARPVRLIRRRR